MIQPSTPGTATDASANRLSYPASIIAGTIILPIAAQVAVGEPDNAPKIMQDRIDTTPNPPGIHPRIASQKSVSLLEIPPEDIRLPASINNGMAIMVKLSSDPNIRCPSTIGLTSPVVNTTSNAAAPRHNAIGAPITSKTKNVTNKIVPIIIPRPHFLLFPFLPEQNLP